MAKKRRKYRQRIEKDPSYKGWHNPPCKYCESIEVAYCDGSNPTYFCHNCRKEWAVEDKLMLKKRGRKRQNED